MDENALILRHRASGDILKACLLVVATFAVYWPAVNGQFIWDDVQNVSENQTLRSVEGLGRSWYRIEENLHFYPLTYSSFWIDYQLWNLSTTGYHLTNVLLHAMGSLFLCRVLKTLAVPGAWVAATVFALHPVHVESVAWITERKNVLCGVFFLASLLAYLRYLRLGEVRSRQDRSAITYAVSLVLFLFALLSKTTACTLPAVILLLIWWKTSRMVGKDVLHLAPFFVLGIAFGMLTAWVETETSFVGTVTALDHPFGHRCLIAGWAIWFYAGKLVYPSPLMFVYPQWQPDIHDLVQLLYPSAVIAVVAILWFGRSRFGRGPLVGALCFCGTLFPALSFFDVYFMRYSFVADHFQYLSSMALIALIVAVGHSACERIRRCSAWIGPVAAAIVVMVLSLMTWHDCHAFRDEHTLWNDTIRKNPDAWLAHHNLGVMAQNRGEWDAAIRHYGDVLAVNQEIFETHKNLAEAHRQKGDLDQALFHGRRALDLGQEDANVYYILGMAFQMQGFLDEAIVQLRRAVELQSDYAVAYFDLAYCLELNGKFDEAIGHYRRSLEIRPDDVPSHHNLAGVLLLNGDVRSALQHYRAAMLIEPNRSEVHFGYARALETDGRLGDAFRHYDQAHRLRPGWPEPLLHMARILRTHPDPEARDPGLADQLERRAAQLTSEAEDSDR